MPEPLVLLVGLLLGAALVVPPLLQPRVEGAAGKDERDAAAVRHRVAIETLRDVEADRQCRLAGRCRVRGPAGAGGVARRGDPRRARAA